MKFKTTIKAKCQGYKLKLRRGDSVDSHKLIITDSLGEKLDLNTAEKRAITKAILNVDSKAVKGCLNSTVFRLRGTAFPVKTLEEVWEDYMKSDPKEIPGLSIEEVKNSQSPATGDDTWRVEEEKIITKIIEEIVSRESDGVLRGALVSEFEGKVEEVKIVWVASRDEECTDDSTAYLVAIYATKPTEEELERLFPKADRLTIAYLSMYGFTNDSTYGDLHLDKEEVIGS